MQMRYLFLTLVLLVACQSKPASSGAGRTVVIANDTGADAVVYFSFGADSVVLPSDWTFCKATGNLNCSFAIHAHSEQVLPLKGYLNATLAFNSQVGCNSTKAELNINNPKWYDVMDISLVDGYSNKIQISDGTKTIGPPNGKDGNEKVFGLYPYGCDICTGRQNPPCGIPAGGTGCKAGTQYKPDVPCQYQGDTMGGGKSAIRVSLVQ